MSKTKKKLEKKELDPKVQALVNAAKAQVEGCISKRTSGKFCGICATMDKAVKDLE